MESAHRVIRSINNWLRRKSPSVKVTPETLHPIPGWDYETYREYLLALSKGREYLLPIEEYPSKMDLNEMWHETFNQIRPHSYESWALIGFEHGQRRLILPKMAEKGLNHSVPYEVEAAGLEKARAKAGITDLVGDIHSHPRNLRDLSWYIPPQVTSAGSGAFSLRDLYGFLCDLSQQRPSDPKRSIMFIVEGNENIAAFATRRSLEIVRNNFSGSYEQFAKQWYERYGWNFKDMRPQSQSGGELAEPFRADASTVWQINKSLAYHYQIALYRGFRDKPLLREYPSRNGS